MLVATSTLLLARLQLFLQHLLVVRPVLHAHAVAASHAVVVDRRVGRLLAHGRGFSTRSVRGRVGGQGCHQAEAEGSDANAEFGVLEVRRHLRILCSRGNRSGRPAARSFGVRWG